MEIKGIYTIANTDPNTFYNDLSEAISKLQTDKQEVEVQYTTNVLNDNQIVMTALVLGRK